MLPSGISPVRITLNISLAESTCTLDASHARGNKRVFSKTETLSKFATRRQRSEEFSLCGDCPEADNHRKVKTLRNVGDGSRTWTRSRFSKTRVCYHVRGWRLTCKYFRPARY